MGEMLLELEQCISKAKYLLSLIDKNRVSKLTISDINRIDILLEVYINEIIYLSTNSISYMWIDSYFDIKKHVLEIITILERELK